MTSYSSPSSEFIYIGQNVYPLCESEGSNYYEIGLLVEDNGPVRRSDTNSVGVTVNDVNTETPVFERASYVSLIANGSLQGNELTYIFTC